jgi:transposase
LSFSLLTTSPSSTSSSLLALVLVASSPFLTALREAYLRLRTLSGEQAQVDWSHFGHLEIGRAQRPLMGFVMVLSWSRHLFLRFFLGAHMENFLRGQVGAFAAWGGVPRTLLYDNLKSAVLERKGQAIRFNPVLLSFAGHHRHGQSCADG